MTLDARTNATQDRVAPPALQLGDVPEWATSELVTVDPRCGGTQHSFWEGNAALTEGERKPYLFCQQCGEVRRVEVPA